MKNKSVIAWLLLSFMYLNVSAQEDLNEKSADSPIVAVDTFYSYNAAANFSESIVKLPGQPRPEKWGFIKHVPNNLWQIAKSPFQKKNVSSLALVAASTILLMWKDQEIANGVSTASSKIHLDPTTRFKPVLQIKDVMLLKVPDNLNSALYQMGDGGTSLFLAGGLFVYGKMHHDNRALQAASDVTETVITIALATQTIKRITGRQEPFKATRPGGAWQWFPSFDHFGEDKANYDAFPSGHVATLTATVTVLAENYPEKKWIKPVGYSLVGMLAYALSNTQVHWASDFPLGFALGYISGKITASRHKKNIPGERSYIIP